jgi:hypothetical protein
MVAEYANPPAAVLSGWRLACHARLSLAGMMKIDYFWVAAPSSMNARRRVDWGFAFLIAIQWVLVGGFPLVQLRRWWWEPGAFITICAALGFALVLVPPLREVALVPATFAAFAWFWWLGLFVWKSGRLGWGIVSRRRAATS